MRTRIFTGGLAGFLLLIPFSQGLARQDLPRLLQSTTVFTVDPSSNTASGLLHLRNDRAVDVRVHITSGDFISKTTKKGLNAKATFFGLGDKPGAQALEVKLRPGEVLPIRVEVTNVWEAGESEAQILANGATIGTLRVLKYRLPFNVKLIAPNPDKPELAFVEGDPHQLALRNEDPMTYVVRPTLSVKGHTFDASSLVLPPNSSGTVMIDPPSAWFNCLTGLLKEEQVDGLITLRFEPPGAGSDPAWPTRVIPFSARLSSVSPNLQAFAALIYIVVLLVAGGMCSLVLRYWVPNSLRRASLRDRLNEVAERTRSLSVRTSSEIRVGLRVERQRLNERLSSSWTFSPELPALLTETSRRIEELMNHLQLVTKLNELWERVDELYRRGEAPSKVSLIEDDVRSISHSLERIPSTTQDLQAIQVKIDGVPPKMDQLSKSDTQWETELKKYFQELEAERTKLEGAYSSCRDLFLKWNVGWDGIKPEDYDDLDARISILRMIQENVDQLGASSGRAARKEFDEALRRVDYRGARKAMHEIRQGVYREEVIDALKKEQPRPSVSVAQLTVRAYSPVHFAIQFANRIMDDCEALDAIRCQWDFGHDGLRETGWRVAHFFPTPHSYAVKATFWYEGRQITYAGGKPVEIPQEIRAEGVPAEKQDRTRVELIQLAIALLIALLGLLAGAREQLQKLDFLAATVALFLLGFGADSIKAALAPAKGGKESQPDGT